MGILNPDGNTSQTLELVFKTPSITKNCFLISWIEYHVIGDVLNAKEPR